MTAWRVARRALLWCVAVIAAAMPIPFVLGAVVAVTTLRTALIEADKTTLYTLGGMVGVQTAMFCIARHLGTAAGDGDLRRGVGDGPVRRPVLVGMIAVLLSAFAFFVTLGVFLASPAAVSRLTGSGLWAVPVYGVMLIIVAPLAEELFFRGWLWTGLREHWGSFATASFTGALWLLIHVFDGVGRVALLLPAAVALSVARHLGGSVRASILVHASNNLITAATPWIALRLGWLAWPSIL